MRPPALRLIWAATAVGTAAVLGLASAHLVPGRPSVLAAGPVLGSAGDTVEPSSPDASLTQVVLSAVERAGGVDVAGGGACPTARLALSYSDPGPGWRSGGFLAPLGPAPTLATVGVNGVVLCAGSHYAYVGFDAVRTARGWDVELVPDPAGGVDDETVGTNEPDRAPVPAPLPPATSWVGRASGVAIEGYARYEGQTTCDPSAKPGTLALRDLLLSHYPATHSSGISRGCSVGGRSEHKEGRAFDWGANLGVAAQRRAAEDFLGRLLATDSHGNRHAMARRMGVMYVIWDHRMWSAYRADAGWRSYSGSSPHTDHVHVSLSWAGARGLTSFWSGDVVAGLSPVPTGGGVGATTVSARRTSPGTGGGTAWTGARRHRSERPAPVDGTSAPRDRSRDRTWDWTRDRAWDRQGRWGQDGSADVARGGARARVRDRARDGTWSPPRYERRHERRR